MPNCDTKAKNMSGQKSNYVFINAALHLMTQINHIDHNILSKKGNFWLLLPEPLCHQALLVRDMKFHLEDVTL